ncbi:uncharacterized protein LOC107262964 isoform X2 [Cephus cinctus]|uniref:Uncharacterized protein LOC107262964 isoform X2 n=1 Tax=Cephus cinctus TaxID=211228 RepID=A0AAJ7R877_CEPCN|nr:uncharacterized protein LOC107262964 isoform X2 [Cephus cinctus]
MECSVGAPLSTMTTNLLFYIALQFAPVVILAEYARLGNFDLPMEKSCIDFEVSDLENYISKVNFMEIPTVEAMAAGFKCPVNALPFGALKSDWLRLLRLYDAQPAGSVLKEKLPRLYRLLVLAYQTMPEKVPVFTEEHVRHTNEFVNSTDSTPIIYGRQPEASALPASRTISIISDLTQNQNSLESNNEFKGTTLDLEERSLRNTRNTDDYGISKISYTQESTRISDEGFEETSEIVSKFQTSESTRDFNQYRSSPSVLIKKLKTTDTENDVGRITDEMKSLSSTSAIDTDIRKNVIVENVLDISSVSFTEKSNALDNVDGEAIATTKWIEEITMTRKRGYLGTVDNDDKEEDLTNTTISGNDIINETNILILVTPDKQEDINEKIKATTDGKTLKEMIKQNNYFDADNLTGSTSPIRENQVIKSLGTTVTVPPDDITSLTFASNYKYDKDPSSGSPRYYSTPLFPASKIYSMTGSVQEETSRTTEGIPKDNGSRSTSGEDYYSEVDSKYSPASSSSDELDVSGIKTVTDVSLEDPHTSGERKTITMDTELTAKEFEKFTVEELVTGTVPGVITSRESEGESLSQNASSEVSLKEELTSPRWPTYESTDLSYSRTETILAVGSQGAGTGSSITGSFFSPGLKGTSPGLTGSDFTSRTSSISPSEALDYSDESTTSVPRLDEKVSEMDSNGIGYFTDNTGSTMSSFDIIDKESSLPSEGIQVGDVNERTNKSLETKSEITTSKSLTEVKYVTSKNNPTTTVTFKETKGSVNPSTRLWRNNSQNFKTNNNHPQFFTSISLGRNVTGTGQESKKNRNVLPFVLKKVPSRNIQRYQGTPLSILTYNVKRPASSSTLDENGEEVVFVPRGSSGIRVPLLTRKRSESNANVERQYRWFFKEGGKLDENERRKPQDLPERVIPIACRNEE